MALSESASELLHFLDKSALDWHQQLEQDGPPDSAVWSMVQGAVSRAGGRGEIPIPLQVDISAAFAFDYNLGRSLLLDPGELQHSSSVLYFKVSDLKQQDLDL
jgi:hypothetical protein